MRNLYWKKILNKGNFAFALKKIVRDLKGDPIDFKIIDINDKFEEITGLKTEEVIGKKTSQLTKYHQELHWIKEFFRFINEKDEEETVRYEYIDNNYYRITNFYITKNLFVTIISDITENELRMVEFEHKYKIIANNIFDNIWIVDLDFNFTYVSPSIYHILGYTDIETIGRNLKDITAKDSFEIIHKAIEENLEFEKLRMTSFEYSGVFEVKQLKKDGSIVNTEQTIKFLKNKYGQITGFLGLSRDITERKLSQQAILKKEEELRIILDSTAEGIYGVDLDGNCIFCNKSCLKILGYDSEDEVLGKNTHLLFHHHKHDGDESDINDCTIASVIKTGQGVHNDEDIYWKKDGTSILVEYFSYPQYHDGKIIGAVVTFFDITERKKVEISLKESNRSKSVLLANLPGMAYRCKHDRDWTMIFVSEGFYNLTGYKPEQLINNRDLSYNDIIFEEYREYLWGVWERAISLKSSIKEEYPIITANGRKKWVLEQGQPVYDENGKVIALEGLVIDIDDQKRKEEEIRYLSYHDGLTGLHNRIYFEIQKSLLNNPKYLPLSIIIGDINGLKLINDAFGHAEGDKLIVATARIIERCCRENDVIARTGGDEFTVLLPNTDGEIAYQMLKNIKLACEDDTSLYKSNISLGFATKEKVEDEFSDIQKLAEDFMYKRKLLGRNSIHNSIILSITAALFEKSHETEEHSQRMRELSIMLGNKLDLLQVELDELSLLATLHDIGKVSIDSKILNKPGKLTQEEWIEIKKHPDVGYRIAKASPELSSIADYILTHHERWDGNGYPQGLKGEDIPLLSRIISIVDAYDAMTSERPYRKTITKEEALNEILNNAGTQFDPLLAQLFYEIMTDEEKEIKYSD